MRDGPTLLHLDMDAFYASVEQATKPSLRGKPVVVGGTGPRGVVATASYEARRHGVRSAMPIAQARRQCPNAAYLHPRFPLYREVSDTVMAILAELSPLVEPLSLDEAFVDLTAVGLHSSVDVRTAGENLRAAIRSATGLGASVGLAGTKMLAKIASDAAKPDGLLLLEPGSETGYLSPLPVRALPGIGPATTALLRRSGIVTVGDAAASGVEELVRLLGRAHGTLLYDLARGIDDRPVVPERDAKSVSVEDTFSEDVTDRTRVQGEVDRLAQRCTARLRAAGRAGRTVVLKVRSYDFTTLTRSETLRGATDDPGVVREAAARLLAGIDTTAGVRLLGVGVSGLTEFTQEDLFAQAAQAAEAARAGESPADRGSSGAGHRLSGGPASGGTEPVNAGTDAFSGSVAPAREPEGVLFPDAPQHRTWPPGADVAHAEYGPGWVQGSGVGRVTVRFETPSSPPGRVRTFGTDDPALQSAAPQPLPGAAPGTGQSEGRPSPDGPDAPPEASSGPEGDGRAPGTSSP